MNSALHTPSHEPSRRLHALLGVTFVIATIVACSSENGGGGSVTSPATAQVGGSQVQCKSATATSSSAPSDKACVECGASSCLSEIQSAFGSDPSRFGGACADFATCTCDCATGDAACSQACLPKLSPACQSASEAYAKCTQDKCRSQCPATTPGGGGGPVDGGQPDSGAGPLRGGCTGEVDQDVYPGGRACTDIYTPSEFDYGTTCTGSGQTFYANGCPSADRVGRCTTRMAPNITSVQMYYGLSAADAKQACDMVGGAFEPG